MQITSGKLPLSKKMKKYRLAFLLFTLLCNTTSYTQEFYLKAGIGYSFPMPGQKVDQNGNVLNGTLTQLGSGVSAYQLKSASFSAGLQNSFSAGLQLSKNIAVELATNINTAAVTYTETLNGLTNSNGVVYNYQGTRQAKNTTLILPSMVLQTAKAKWNAYMRMGLTLPVLSGIKLNETYIYQTGIANQYSWNIRNYFSAGIASAAGVKIRVSKKVELWSEASLICLNLSRKIRVLESAVVDGQNVPVGQLTGVTTYHYHINGTSDLSGNQQALPQPYSSIGINAGISYDLKAEHRKKKK